MTRRGVNAVDLCCLAGLVILAGWGVSSYQLAQQPVPQVTGVEPAVVREEYGVWLNLTGSNLLHTRVVIAANVRLPTLEKVSDEHLRVYLKADEMGLGPDSYDIRALNGWGRGTVLEQFIKVHASEARLVVESYRRSAWIVEGTTAAMNHRELRPLLTSFLNLLGEALRLRKPIEMLPALQAKFSAIQKRIAEDPALLASLKGPKDLEGLEGMVRGVHGELWKVERLIRYGEHTAWGDEEDRLAPASKARSELATPTLLRGEEWVMTEGWLRVDRSALRRRIRRGDTAYDYTGRPVATVEDVAPVRGAEPSRWYPLPNGQVVIVTPGHRMTKVRVLLKLRVDNYDGIYFHEGRPLASAQWIPFVTKTWRGDIQLISSRANPILVADHRDELGETPIEETIEVHLKVRPESVKTADQLLPGRQLLNVSGDVVGRVQERLPRAQGGATILRISVRAQISDGEAWTEVNMDPGRVQLKYGSRVSFGTLAGPLGGTIIDRIDIREAT